MAINLNGTGSITGLSSISSPTISGGSFPAGTAAAPGITLSGDSDTGLYSPGANQIALSTSGTAAVTVDASQRVGIGATSLNDAKLEVRDAGDVYLKVVKTGINSAYLGSESSIGVLASDGPLVFRVGTAPSATERARIDSSGRLLVGTSTSAGTGSTIQAIGNNRVAEFFRYSAPTGNSGPSISLTRSASNTVGTVAAVAATDELGQIGFRGAGNGTTYLDGAKIAAVVESGTVSGSSLPTRLVFSTTADGASSPTERMRITNEGRARFFSNDEGISCGVAGTTKNIYTGVNNSTSTVTGNLVFVVRGDGDVENTNNSYGAISDIKLKENIVDANSQWDDLKALQVRNYNFKEGQTHTQIGLIAQEVELVSPGLVSECPDRDEEGNDLGTFTKSVNYSVLYMKAVKALQEAMERIETLEASNTDLLARVSALESA